MFIPSKAVVKRLLNETALASFLLSLVLMRPLFAGGIESQKKISFDFDSLSPVNNTLFSAETYIPLPEPGIDNPVSTETAKDSCEFKVYFIDVKQGDSEFIQLPDCKTVLIDGGPSSSASSNLAKFLTGHNITSIDYVVLTHPHTDHFRGLQYVFENLSVANFYDTRQNNSSSSTLQKVRETAKNEPGINIFYPAEGETLSWSSGVEVKVLNSCSNPGDSSDGNVLNDCSIVIKMTYQNASILFMGDAESDVEARLVSKYADALRADVLKVAHHGSNTASSELFLSYVKPKTAYVSVAAKNSYGLPNADALSRIEAAGAVVHRTDKEGTMEYAPFKEALQPPLPPAPANSETAVF